jgi:chemotaxis protein MotA
VFVIVGSLVVIACVVGGFLIEGGPILVLMQYVEFMIIGGAAAGALLISTPKSLLTNIFNQILGTLKESPINRQMYLDLLKMMYEFFVIGQKEGMIALESHIEAPEKSAVFSKYSAFMNQHHLVAFLTDTVRLSMIGGVSPHELEALMDTDIETHHQEGVKPGMILQKIGDSMPGMGIVAAVLGIVITMQAINGPPEEIGKKVAAALVGTFLGILLSYGFIQPLATKIDLVHEEESRTFEVVKAGLIAFAKGLNPLLCVEFARRTISAEYRPTFQEMENLVKGRKNA